MFENENVPMAVTPVTTDVSSSLKLWTSELSTTLNEYVPAATCVSSMPFGASRIPISAKSVM
jgi:hypothetical protein